MCACVVCECECECVCVCLCVCCVCAYLCCVCLSMGYMMNYLSFLVVITPPKKKDTEYVDSRWGSARSKFVSKVTCSTCSPSKRLPLYVFTFWTSEHQSHHEPPESSCMSCHGLRIIKSRHMHLASGAVGSQGMSGPYVDPACKSSRMIEETWATETWVGLRKYMKWLKWYWRGPELSWELHYVFPFWVFSWICVSASFLAMSAFWIWKLPFQLFFATFIWSWNLSFSIEFAAFWWTLWDFGAASCRFNCICNIFEFEPFILDGICTNLQHFVARTVHVTW